MSSFSFAVTLCSALSISCATSSLAAWHSSRRFPPGLQLVALGGIAKEYELTQDVDIISTATNAHTSGSAIPIHKDAFGSAMINNTVFIVGGMEPSRNASSTLAYNVAANTWATLQHFPLEIEQNAVVAVNNTLYSLGGFEPGYGFTNYTYKYDLTAQVWTKIPTLLPSHATRISCAAATPSGSIYLRVAPKDLYRTDDGAQSWVKLTSSKSNRWSTSCAFLPQRNAIMLAGSQVFGSSEAPANSVELYDIATDTWTEAPSLTKARGLAGAAVIPGSDDVIVCGGTGNDADDMNADCELYDAAENQWKTTDFGLNMPRYNFGFFALQN